MMFQPEDRARIHQRLIELAHADPRVVAAAAVGSTASGGDRWSDIDLTFGVGEGATLAELLADWTEVMESEFQAAVLFDLPHRQSIYRVFLVPGCLQADLSFTPQSDFGAMGSRFSLIFGEAIEHPPSPPQSASDQFGLGVHHLVRARICIERGRLWQALHWLNTARDQAMTLACQRLGLDTHYGRGFDQLPVTLQDSFRDAIPANLTAESLRCALLVATAGLLAEGDAVPAGLKMREILEQLDEGDAS